MARYAHPLYGLLLLYFRNDHRIFPPYSFHKYVKYIELNNMNSGMRKSARSLIYSLRSHAPCFDISLLPATVDWASIRLVKYYRHYNHKSFGDPIPLLDLLRSPCSHRSSGLCGAGSPSPRPRSILRINCLRIVQIYGS